MPSTTAATSAPTASHMAATALTNEIFIARKPLAAYLIVSADAGSVIRIGASTPSVQIGDALGGAAIGTADHHPVGREEVADRRSLTQEFGVRHDEHVGALQRRFDDHGGTDRDRRLVDDHGAGLEHGSDLTRGLFDVRQVGAAVVALRRRHAEEHDVGVASRLLGAEHERQQAGRSTGVDDARQTVLDDRDHAVVQHVDLALIDVSAGHTVPEMGEAGSGRQADVSGTHHAESDHGLL